MQTGNIPLTYAALLGYIPFMENSNTDIQPLSSDEIRAALVKTAEDFCRENKTSFSAVSQSAVNDSKFLHKVKKGDNFSLRTYQRVLDWINKGTLTQT